MVIDSMDKLKSLTEKQKLMTMASNLKTNYRYDKMLQQEQMIGLSKCDTMYELTSSILSLSIIQGKPLLFGFAANSQRYYRRCISVRGGR